ncbi:hypothetical protein LLE87_37165, partial [Paenibacillus polymyxa]|nr:hypothetical protein [Paenibacillus polymyxa]
QWFTPAHVLGGWRARLRRREAEEGARAFLPGPVATTQEHVDVGAAAGDVPEIEQPLQVIPKAVRQAAAAGQMSLF